jgi:hypothetical protein
MYTIFRHLLDILDTRVRLELARSSLPVNLTLAQVLDDRNDGVDWTDELVRGVSFTADQLLASKR